MRRIRYAVATSLDGYIAGPKGEADWIIMDPTIDFSAIFNEFDMALVGRRTFEPMAGAGKGTMPGMKTFVFSRTLRQQDYPDVTIVAENAEETVSALKRHQARTSGCSVAAYSFAVSSTQGLWIRLRSLSCRCSSAGAFRCFHLRPSRRS